VPSEKAPSSMFEDPNAVQLRVSLLGIEPSVWRRLIIPITFNLLQLHNIIQSAFGWKDYHLHHFKIGGLRYGDAKLFKEASVDDAEPRTFESATIMLRDFDFGYRDDGGPAIEYVYDYGDNWVHAIEFEKQLILNPEPKSASCIGGARACPPEDCGGPHGYAEFLRALLTPEADELEQQREMKVWSGGKFHPGKFDLAKTDKAVHAAHRRRRAR
jgi:hypothetical protein